MDSQDYDKMMQDLASWYYDNVGVDWHKGSDVVDMGDDGNGDGYQAYEIETIELDDIPRIFANGEHQANFEEQLVNIIEEMGNE